MLLAVGKMSKALVARTLAKKVKDGDVIGLGSGSTAELAVAEIGKRIARDKIRVTGVPTSYRIALLAQDAGVQVLSPITDVKLAWAFDGADEVDPAFNMIKGNGAAMLSEKIVAKRAGANFLVIVTDDKFVDRLGTKFPVPVEVIPAALPLVLEGLKKLGAKEAAPRPSNSKYGPTISEHNNIVVDARFESIVPELELKIKSLTGVVESGLFINMTNELFVARESGVYSRKLVGGAMKEELVEAA